MQTHNGGYDAVVLGCGLGGLVCAAYLARAGARPLLLESQHRIGGRCGSNSHRGFALDRMPFISHKTLLEAMAELGIELNWRRLPPNPAYIETLDSLEAYPGLSDPDELARLLGQPREVVTSYRKMMDELGEIPRSQAPGLKGTRLIDWVGPQRWIEIEPAILADFQFRPWAITPQQAPELSVGELVNVLSSGGPTESAVPQPKLYPADPAVGGMQSIPASFGKAIERWGGRIRTNCTVLEASVHKGRVSGVSFLNEDRVVEEIPAGLIISDIPVWNALGAIFDSSLFPAKMTSNAGRLAEWEAEGISIGIALRKLPTRRADGRKEDQCRWCRLLLEEAGRLTYGGGFIVSSIGSPASAPRGRHLLIVGRAVPRGTTRNLPLMRSMVSRSLGVLRRIYSDLDQAVEWWRLLPVAKVPPIHCLSTVPRPGIVTPVEGLYFVGDTVETGDGRPHSLDLAVFSGRQAARIVIGRAGATLPGGG